MKIGIMTLSASDNCGSLLQAYALKRLLEGMKEHQVEIINFSTEQSHSMYDIIPKHLWKHPRTLFYHLKSYRKIKASAQDYKNFRRNQLGIKGKEIFPEHLEQIKNTYDMVVVGSDQVWNVSMRDHDNAFFLNWTNARKIAYAPSLGGHDLEEADNYSQIVDWLNEFDAISVRENKGKACLEKALKKQVALVLDPTLLLTSDCWEKIVDDSIVKGDYIFYYSWAYNEDCINDIVKMDAEKIGLPVYVIDALKWTRNSEKKWNFKLCDDAGPGAFLNLMFYAKKCYVQSFHGMIFAYQFKKNVWLLDSNKDLNKMDTRLKELLKQIDMEDRVVTPYNVNSLNLETFPDYEKKKSINNIREQSLSFLSNSLVDTNN